MRHPVVLLLAIAMLRSAALSSGAEPSTGAPAVANPTPPDTSRLLADFRTNLPGILSNGSWQGKLGLSPNGLVIQGNKGADGKGEMLQNLEPSLDLSKEKYVELALGVGARNEVSEITIAFSDVDGTQYAARIRIDQILPQQPVWFRVKLADFKLNDWQGTKAGKGIDWTRIAQWHLQGDWATAAPFHVMFIALRTRQ